MCLPYFTIAIEDDRKGRFYDPCGRERFQRKVSEGFVPFRIVENFSMEESTIHNKREAPTAQR